MARLQGNTDFLSTILKNIGELGSVSGARPARSRGFDPTQAALPIQQSASSADPGALAAAGIPSAKLDPAATATLNAAAGSPASPGDPADFFAARKAELKKQIDDAGTYFDANIAPKIPNQDTVDLWRHAYVSAVANDPTQGPVMERDIISAISKNPKRQPYTADQLAGYSPDLAPYANTDPALQDQLIAQNYAEAHRKPTDSTYRPDRTGMPDWTKGLTDTDLSKLILQQKQAEAEGTNSYWPRLKGQSLTLMNNDEFKRSGLRTGDTVCIKIP